MDLTNLLGAAAGYYNTDEAAKAALEIGQKSAKAAEQLGQTAAGMTQFKPFTVTTGLGGATTTPEGGYTLGLSPEQQALQNQLLGQAQGLFGQIGVDPSTAQADLYEQMRAVQRPEEERQRLALEERMLSQGRMGLSSSAYGGSSPELLAQETARQEAMARANLGARTQAMSEQAQALTSASGLMGLGYMPQQRALGALGYGLESAKLADIGRRTGAELFGQLGGRGIQSLMQGLEQATGLESVQRQGLTEALLGRQPTLQEQILGEVFNVDFGSTGGLLGGLLGGLFGGDNDKTKAEERFGEEMIDEPVAGMYDWN